jgi:hypothetical protein
MLTFLLDNKPFNLSLDVSIRLSWVNPACMFDDFPGDVGMGIDIPVTDQNRAMLGNPERFEKYMDSSSRDYPNFEIRFGGVLLMGGTLVITDASQETYKGWLRSNVGNLGKEHREKDIYDIEAFNEERTFVNKADYDPLTDHYGCPTIFNPEFFYDKGRKIPTTIMIPNPDYYEGSGRDAFIEDTDETEALTKAFYLTSGYFVNKLNPDSTVKLSISQADIKTLEDYLSVSVVSPMLFLNYVVETILKDASFFVENNCIAYHEDLKKLILYGNYDITKMFYDVLSMDFHVIDWASGTSVQNYVNIVSTVLRDYTGIFKYKDLLPKINLKDFILSIQNTLNVCFQFRHHGKVDIIDRETILTGNVIDISTYMINSWEMNERKDVTLKFKFSHDDDDTFFKERWADIDDRREDEGEPVNDWVDLANIANPVMGEVRYLKVHNLYVQYALIQKTIPGTETTNEFTEDTLGWEHLSMGFQNGFYNYGKDVEETIETKFSTLFGDQTVFTHHRGNINSMKFAHQNFTPRLLFYHGNNIAKFETDNLSMDWEKENTGLLENRFPKWVRFWATRQPVKGKAQLPLNVLDNIIRNITLKQKSNEGEFIVEKFETTFTLNDIGETNITGFKI